MRAGWVGGGVGEEHASMEVRREFSSRKSINTLALEKQACNSGKDPTAFVVGRNKPSSTWNSDRSCACVHLAEFIFLKCHKSALDAASDSNCNPIFSNTSLDAPCILKTFGQQKSTDISEMARGGGSDRVLNF